MILTPPEFTAVDRLSIGIISDTHGLLRPEAISAMEGADVILHGGDVGDEDILDHLGTIAPVFTVRGNVDYQHWCGRLPHVLNLILGDLSIRMIHDLYCLDRSDLESVGLVVYGHSHQPKIHEENGTVFLNPGSAGPKRFQLPVTAARLEWTRGQKKLAPKLIQLIE